MRMRGRWRPGGILSRRGLELRYFPWDAGCSQLSLRGLEMVRDS